MWSFISHASSRSCAAALTLTGNQIGRMRTRSATNASTTGCGTPVRCRWWRARAGATALAIVAGGAAAQVPPPPAVPTADTCNAYMRDNHARRAAIYREVTDCLRQAPWNFSQRYSHPVCVHPPARIVNETSPYDCPQRAAELCALVEAERDIKACFARAKTDQTASDAAQQRIAHVNRVEAQLGALANARKDPRRVFWEVVEPRLPTDTRLKLANAFASTNSELAKGTVPLALTRSGDHLFAVSLFQHSGELSAKGSSLLQETYDFIHARTLGDRRLLMQRYNNPVVNAIQDTAADEIKRVFSATIGKLDGDIADGFAAITAPPTLRTSMPARAPINTGNADCALLDGPNRTDLAVNEPDAYERLLQRCRR